VLGRSFESRSEPTHQTRRDQLRADVGLGVGLSLEHGLDSLACAGCGFHIAAVKRIARSLAKQFHQSLESFGEASARAEGTITMSAGALSAIESNALAKGDAVSTARIAGIMAAKKTAELIPLCHNIPLSDVGVDVEADKTLPGLRVKAWASSRGKTGVEMEALTAATVALLTLYDMAKSIDRSMEISCVRLTAKRGGKSGDWSRT